MRASLRAIGAAERPSPAVVALLLALTIPVAASAAPLRSSAFLTYAVPDETTVTNEGKHLEKVSVFAYHVTREGDVVPPNDWVPGAVERLAAGTGTAQTFVTVNNRVLEADGRPSQQHDGEAILGVLSDPAKRAEHIRQIVGVVGAADGVELNYERLKPEIRELFTTFIRELRAALPADKKLSIVLQPKTTNAPGENGRAVDWRAIEPYADHMRIMAYYYSYSTSPPGPVVPLETLRALARYALDDPEQSIPAEKVSIILSLWGWDWPTSGTETAGRLVPWDTVTALAADHAVQPTRDPVEGSLHFGYTDAAGIAHEVWIDDLDSIRQRVELLEVEGMPRIDFWHLGTGDPRFAEYLESRTAPDGSPPPPSTSPTPSQPPVEPTPTLPPPQAKPTVPPEPTPVPPGQPIGDTTILGVVLRCLRTAPDMTTVAQCVGGEMTRLDPSGAAWRRLVERFMAYPPSTRGSR